ncbi:MAG: histidine kinase N-terminal 7TM domain-containing protein, partial [Ruminococcus sp.]|nr:histidine kinase N-terminal 7TM domain-containing protein [Ruminococcus sp.]
MKKRIIGIVGLLIILFTFSSCSQIGDKTASLTVVYIITSVLALMLLAGYCFMIRKKDPWFLLLFSAVFVVNVGYLTLAISATLEEALLANRISYLGSVFLPLSMFMIIINTCKIRYKKRLPALLLTISTFVFLVAASPGYLDIYYKSVTLQTINGVTVLDKVYGPWHKLYLYYLLVYFSAMIATIIFASVKKKIESSIHAVILAIAVFVNIGVWLLEQIVKIDFEFLSVSYIVSELFLLGLYLL